MEAAEIYNLLQNPKSIQLLRYEELEELLVAYPYFQGVRMLLLKKYYNQQDSTFNQHLALAATYAPDRSRLFDFLNEVEGEKDTASDKVEEAAVEKKNDNLKHQPEELIQESNELETSLEEETSKLTGSPDKLTKESPQSKEQPIEDWLMDFEPPRMNVKEDLGNKRSFKLPRIPVLDKGMLDFLDSGKAEPRKRIPVKAVKEKVGKEVDIVTPPQKQAGRRIRSQNKDLESFDFFSEQTDAFLKRIASRDKGKKKQAEKEPTYSFSENSLEDNEEVVSETLADLLAKQGQSIKAIKMYEALILKIPEKNRYFARKIEALR
jgi:hypothetical protein